MKYIFLFLLISFSATAQIDSSKLNITLIWKQSTIDAAGSMLQARGTIYQAPIFDTLRLRRGANDKPDSAIVLTVKAAQYLSLLEGMTQLRSFENYKPLDVLISGDANVSGLITQLNTKISTNNQRAAATWLRRELLALFAEGEKIWQARLKSGADYLKNGYVD